MTRTTVIRTGMLSMLALIALGGTRVVHISLVNRVTDNATLAVIGSLIGLAMTAGLFLPGGLASAASKFIPFQRGAGNPANARRVYHWLTGIGYAVALLSGLVVAAIAVPLLDVSPLDGLSVGLLTAAFSLYSVEKGALYGFDRVTPYVRLELAGSAVAIASTVLVIAIGATTYLLPLTLGYSVLVLGGWWSIWRQRRREPATADAAEPTVDRREIIGYVTLASIGGVASAGLLQLLPLLAVQFTTGNQASYVVAAVFLVGPLYFLPRALGMALFPAMAHAHGAGDTATVRRHLDLSTRALLVVLAPVFAAGIFLAREVLMLFFTARYVDGDTILQLMLVATYLAVIQVAAVNALSSGDRRDVRIPVTAAVVSCVVGVGLAAPLGYWLGGAGVSLAYLVAAGLSAAPPLVVVWRRYEMAWAGPGLRALLGMAAAFGVARLVDLAPVTGVARILLDIGAAVVIGAVVALLLARDLRDIIGAARRRPEATDDSDSDRDPELLSSPPLA